MLDFLLWFLLQVEHYKSASLHADYEQNSMKTAHIDIQAYIHALDLTFILEQKQKSYELYSMNI
jgi:hypothetical protein